MYQPFVQDRAAGNAQGLRGSAARPTDTHQDQFNADLMAFIKGRDEKLTVVLQDIVETLTNKPSRHRRNRAPQLAFTYDRL